MTKSQSTAKLSVSLAPFWKRLAAWIYDLLGALAVFILALVVGYLFIYLVSSPWIDDGESLAISINQNPLWALYLFIAVQYYYVWCWVKGGQTLGMKTWQIKLCKPDGQHLSWREAYIRSFVSLGGLGQIWGLFDKQNRGVQDIICDCRVVQLPKTNRKPDKPLI